MAFKTVQSLDADTVIALGGRDKKTKKENPTSIEGYYLGKREVKGGKFSDITTIYFFQTAKGNIGVWGKTDLSRKMNSVEPGTMVRVNHAGMKPTPNGDMHTYQVEYDDSNTIDVSDLQTSQVTSNYEDTEETTDTEDDTDDDSQEDYRDEQVAQATTTAVSRKEKVQALLNRKTVTKN